MDEREQWLRRQLRNENRLKNVWVSVTLIALRAARSAACCSYLLLRRLLHS